MIFFLTSLTRLIHFSVCFKLTYTYNTDIYNSCPRGSTSTSASKGASSSSSCCCSRSASASRGEAPAALRRRSQPGHQTAAASQSFPLQRCSSPNFFLLGDKYLRLSMAVPTLRGSPAALSERAGACSVACVTSALWRARPP